MFSHILVSVDGSIASDRAVRTAAAMGRAFDAHVSVVCVVDPYPFSGVGTDMTFAQDDYLNAATTEAKQAVNLARQLCEASGVQVSTSVLEGRSVYAAIIEAANYNPLEEDSPDSVFCSHGAGHVVPWNEVRSHAHCEPEMDFEI